ncbi:MAG: EamA family transporter [Bacteroidota bacterium]
MTINYYLNDKMADIVPIVVSINHFYTYLQMKNILVGIVFAIFWASASAATKIGLGSAEPFVLANVRFILAGLIMLAFAIFTKKSIKISKTELGQLTIYGFLNVTLYLGAFVVAIKHVSAGIGSLSTATNPLFITILAAILLKKNSKFHEWMGLVFGMTGVILATYPLLKISYADTEGLVILLISMLSYSLGTVYYSSKVWNLDRLVINGWQVFLGGIMLLPLTLYFYEKELNTFDLKFWLSVSWLIFPVSILAVQLWLYLLSVDPVKASIWLFLCPIFGFLYSNLLLNEPVTWHTFAGTGIVLIGLFVGQIEKFRKRQATAIEG